MFKTSLYNTCLITLICWLTACGAHKDTPASTMRAGQSPKASVVEKMKEMDHLPVGERVTLYNKLKKEQPDAYDFANEQELTLYGYSMLWNNNVADALVIFRLIATEFPGSSNAYDSLGEAYLAQGDTALSLTNYEKSLQMDPGNFNAEDQIERIHYPERKPEKPAEKFAKVYTAEQYRADLDQLAATLIKVHPNVFKFTSEAAFRKMVEAKKALITDQTTYGAFRWYCGEIIAGVHCSHTSLGGFYYENDMLSPALRFPLRTHWVDGRLYVIDSLNTAGKLKIKDEILSINGVAAAELVQDICRHIPAQGQVETTQPHVFNAWSTGMIAYALGFPETYRVVVKGLNEPVTLNLTETVKDPFPDPLNRCKGLCLDMQDDKTAVLTIATFNYYPWNNLPVFQHFIDSSMAEIDRKGIKNLVIDLRFNGGGASEASIYLLRYLTGKPFIYFSKAEFEGKTEKLYGEETVKPFRNRFKGKLYFLIDGLGNSTTGHFMSLVKAWHLGTIVGEELGSNQFCSAGQKTCRLKHTKLEYYVANNTHKSTATSLPDERGILPDHVVSQSVDDYLGRIDVVKAYALALIRNEK